MKRLLVLAFLFSSMINEIGAVDFSGYVQNWTALRTGENNEILLNRNRFRLNSGFSGSSGGAWSSIDFTSNGHGTSDEIELNIRELYLDLYLGNWDLRIGKQQVVWGKADGVFVNDIVNPFDLRFFLLQDFEDIRMANSMVKASGYFGSSRLEILFIPVLKQWKFADPGTPWGPPSSVKMNMNGMEATLIRENPELPSATVKNSEWGVRFSTFILGTDLSLLYLDGYQDRTIMEFSSFDMTPGGPVIYMDQVYRRSPMAGLNFSRPLGSILIRGEGALYKKAAFNAVNMDPAIPSPVIDAYSDYVQGVVGIDLTGPFGTSISFQALLKQVLDHDPKMIGVSEQETLFTGLISGSFWNENASAKIMTLLDRENESGLVNSSFSYKVSDMVKAEAGYVNIWGEATATSSQFNFGMFEKNDLVYVKLTYSF